MFAADTLYDLDYIATLRSESSIPTHIHAYIVMRSHLRMRREMKKAFQNLVLSTNVKSPGPLFACTISRADALKKYTRCLEIKGGLKTRFNPIEDTVLLAHLADLPLLPPLPYVPGQPDLCSDYGNQLPGVESLAICTSGLMWGDLPEMQRCLFTQFLALKNLVLVLNCTAPAPVERISSCMQSDDDFVLQTLGQKLNHHLDHGQGVLHCVEGIKHAWKKHLAGISNHAESRHLVNVELTSQILKRVT